MKKFLFRLFLFLLVLLVIGVISLVVFLDSAVKRGVEAFGPALAKVEIRLGSVSLSLLSGSCKFEDLIVGNPEGFKTPSAIVVHSAALDLVPRSLLDPKVVVKSFTLQGPEITFEAGLQGNNLGKIIANLEAATGGGAASAPAPGAKPPKTFEVDDIWITGGKARVGLSPLGGQTATVSLPEIHLKDLGKGPEGVSAAEVAKLILKEIENRAAQASANTLSDVGKGALYITKDPANTAAKGAEKAAQGVGDLFKKKP